MTEQQITIDIKFDRRYNLGNFNHKEYEVKISGTKLQLEIFMEQEKQKLTNYIAMLEEIVDIANDANMLKDRLGKVASE